MIKQLPYAPAVIMLALLLNACERENGNLMVGTLERERIELRVESTEPIISIAAEDGQRVLAGETVLAQDPARHQARLHQAEAERDRAAARLAELRRGPREESIREAQSRLQANEVITRNARADLERAREVFDRGLSDEATLDTARTRWEAAMAREQGDREALTALLNGATAEELQQAQAQVNALEAAVTQARLDLERLVTAAPVDGTIDKILYQVGERPAVGSSVAVMLDNRRTFARIYVPEQLRARMVPGTALPVTIDGVPGSMTGVVRWVSSDASFTPYFALTEHDRSRLSYLAEVDLPDASELPTGLPLQAELAR